MNKKFNCIYRGKKISLFAASAAAAQRMAAARFKLTEAKDIIDIIVQVTP